MNEPVRSIKTICVFCGSSFGNQSIYADYATRLGNLLVERGIGLVYGGGGVGLMGVIARTVMEAGGNVTGVLPRVLRSKELPNATLLDQVYGELILVETMHERKATMARLADGFIAMPGGYGTLDELFEAITWVCTLKATFAQWVGALKQIVKDRPVAFQKKLFHDNAAKFYGI